MSDRTNALRGLYAAFNTRDIDGVLTMLTNDVAWANGMDGGHVHGHDGLRDYWTRQWATVDPHVEPVGFNERPDGSVAVDVQQTIRDLAGNPLEGQTHGLRDKTVCHVFHFRGAHVFRFDIAEETP